MIQNHSESFRTIQNNFKVFQIIWSRQFDPDNLIQTIWSRQFDPDNLIQTILDLAIKMKRFHIVLVFNWSRILFVHFSVIYWTVRFIVEIIPNWMFDFLVISGKMIVRDWLVSKRVYCNWHDILKIGLAW